MKNIIETINESIWSSSKDEIKDITWQALRYNQDKYESRIKELEEYSDNKNKFTDKICNEFIKDILNFISEENKYIKSSIENDYLKKFNLRSKEDKNEIKKAIISGIDKFIYIYTNKSYKL